MSTLEKHPSDECTNNGTPLPNLDELNLDELHELCNQLFSECKINLMEQHVAQFDDCDPIDLDRDSTVKITGGKAQIEITGPASGESCGNDLPGKAHLKIPGVNTLKELHEESPTFNRAVGELINKLETANATVHNMGTPPKRSPAANGAYSEEATQESNLPAIFDHWTAGELCENVQCCLHEDDRKKFFGVLIRGTFFGTITADQLFEPQICLKLCELGIKDCNDIMILIEQGRGESFLDPTLEFVVSVFKKVSAGPPRKQGASTSDMFFANHHGAYETADEIARGFMR
mmetsp:Transcript_8333/g.7312  ORF Transcript_8333/g.7312 Transcript_8333/m.7312 type:complete len:290 (+) Transcript_8333:290-1159(+)